MEGDTTTVIYAMLFLRNLPTNVARLLGNGQQAAAFVSPSHRTKILRTFSAEAEFSNKFSTSNPSRARGVNPNSHADTIFALSSGPMVKSGVAVIRLSGPSCRDILSSLMQPRGETLAQDLYYSVRPSFPRPRHASVRKLYCPTTGDLLDQALVLWMPGPHSFTGEDVCELQVHGSRAVILGLFGALRVLDDARAGKGIRPADAGEFTHRAFDHGRMDLTEVEGLSDLLAAETPLQRKQALRQMEGHLSKQFEAWRKVLVKCLAHTEAVIDFGDDDREDDVDDEALHALMPLVRQLRNDIEFHLQDGGKGELVREGVRVALVGPPNAGKSSLLNLLAKRPAAIVSPIAGTTRDIVEVRMELGGVPCIVSDTAGLRDSTEDPIELEGIKRARDTFKRAQIKVFLSDGSDEQSLQSSTAMLNALLPSLSVAPSVSASATLENDGDDGDDFDDIESYRVMIVRNKIDLQEKKQSLQPGSSTSTSSNSSSSSNNINTSGTIMGFDSTTAMNATVYDISCVSGNGISALEEGLHTNISSLLQSDKVAEESTLITRERHRRHLKICADHLDCFLYDSLLMDSAAEELRLAALELGKVTGRVDVEELLDVIFRDFCIGK